MTYHDHIRNVLRRRAASLRDAWGEVMALALDFSAASRQGQVVCGRQTHDTASIREGAACPNCGAAR